MGIFRKKKNSPADKPKGKDKCEAKNDGNKKNPEANAGKPAPYASGRYAIERLH